MDQYGRRRTALVTVRNYILSAVVPCISLLWGVYFLRSGDEMGFSLLNYYLLLPLNAFVSGILLGRSGTPGLVWPHPLLMGAFSVLLPWATFNGTPYWFGAMLGVLPSLLGLGVVWLFRHLRRVMVTQR